MSTQYEISLSEGCENLTVEISLEKGPLSGRR